MPANENILLIGDVGREIRQALTAASPASSVTAVPTVFDGIAELTRRGGIPNGQSFLSSRSAGQASDESSHFTTILAAAEPIERRPESAVQTLRDLAGNSRLILFGHPTLELLSQKMMKFGCDDYIVTPISPSELQATLSAPNARLTPPPAPARTSLGNDGANLAGGTEESSAEGVGTEPRETSIKLDAAEAAIAATIVTPGGDVDLTAVANVLLDAMLNQPHDPVGWTLRLVNARLTPLVELHYRGPGAPPMTPVPDRDLIAEPVTTPEGPGGVLYASFSYDANEQAVRDLLAPLAVPVGKVVALTTRHAALQKMAITDELTGVYNGRYFRHFLQRILEKARHMHFPVTLLLFDIDDFKRYNDQFGHQVGDEILKQTASLMKLCTREHDLVARIGGDEFAVVFWDKEGPRKPREPRPGNTSRPPHSPVQVFERFKRMIQSEQFTALGRHGQGKLGISAGLAVYPYEGHNVETLIAEADKAMMQGAKKQGKNCLALVGNGGSGTTGML